MVANTCTALERLGQEDHEIEASYQDPVSKKR
jgi:hypothetical protein